MKIAIVIGVSEYKDPIIDNLKACRQDSKYIYDVLKGTDQYKDILLINEHTDSRNVKSKIREFIDNYKDQEIKKLFFYYSGHGEYLENEFYYILSDFNQDKRNTTSLTNSDLDTMLRSLTPTLTIKVVDSCQSGTHYIKGNSKDLINKHLNSTTKSFDHCYFLYSSMQNQFSYADNEISVFTKSFLNALISHSKEKIYYKDIMDYISDDFINNDSQKPFFITQAEYTDTFGILNSNVIDLLKESLKPIQEEKEQIEYKQLEINLKEIIEKDNKKYKNKDEIVALITNLNELILKQKLNEKIQPFYDIKIILDPSGNIDNILNINILAEWLDKNHNNYLIDIKYQNKEYTTKSLSPRYVLENLAYLISLKTKKNLHTEPEYIEKTEFIKEPVSFTTTIDIEDLGASIYVQPKEHLNNLTPFACQIVYLFSKTHIRIFYYYTDSKDVGFYEYKFNENFEWQSNEFTLDDEDQILKCIEKIFIGFNYYIYDSLIKKYDIPKITCLDDLPIEESDI